MLLLYIFQILTLLVGTTWAQRPPRTRTQPTVGDPSPIATTRRPDFTEELHIRSDAETYMSFIQRIRNQARDPRGYTARGVPVLPPQAPAGSTDVPFFDVNLPGGDNGVISLRIRRDNLYIIGWRNETYLQWYELVENERSARLIPGATAVIFPPNYHKIEGDAGATRGEIELGSGALRAAVTDIAGAATRYQMARPMIIFAQMISEAARMNAILNTVVANYDLGFRPSATFTGFENAWSPLSRELLHQDQDQTFNPDRPPAARFRSAVDNLGPQTVEELAQALGLLLREHPATGSSGKHRRSVVRSGVAKRQENTNNPLKPILILPGRPLVQIFRVDVTTLDGSQNLHGTVVVQDCLDVYPLWGRRSNNAEQISAGNTLSIANALRVPEAAGDWHMLISLSNREMDVAGDENVIADSFWWSDTPGYQRTFGELQTRNIRGTNGKGKLVYTVMKNAAEALIEVILINGDNEDPAQVYGTINARISKFPKQKITLFDTPSDQSVDVKPGQQIPLRGRAVAVPMNEALSFTLDLWEYDTISSNDKIVGETTTYKPRLLQSVSKNLRGDYGEVEVRVSWL